MLVYSGFIVFEVLIDIEHSLDGSVDGDLEHEGVDAELHDAVVGRLGQLDGGAVVALCRAGPGSAVAGLVRVAGECGRSGVLQEHVNVQHRTTLAPLVLRVARNDVLLGVLDALLVNSRNTGAVAEVADGREGPAGAALLLITNDSHAGRPLCAGIEGSWEGSSSCDRCALNDWHLGGNHQVRLDLLLTHVGKLLVDFWLPGKPWNASYLFKLLLSKEWG